MISLRAFSLLLFLLLHCFPLVGAVKLSCVSGTDVFFINGVWVMDETDVRDSSITLMLKLRAQIAGTPIETNNCIAVSYAHNKSNGHIPDLIEASDQLWFNIIPADLDEHVAKYRQSAQERHNKLILIGHSQGNLYASQAYARLTTQSPVMTHNDVRVIGVATPDSSIAGEQGPDTTLPYTTLTEDLIATVGFFAVNPWRLVPNTHNNQFPGCLSASLCHEFIDSYLNGNMSGPRILNHLVSAITALSQPPLITGYSWQRVPTASGALFGGGRGDFDMAHDPQRGHTVVFGGMDNLGGIYSDTLIWNGVDWARVYPTQSPEGRHSYAMAYDEERKVVVLFGGTSNYGNFWGDTWLWNGTTWTNVPVVGPGPRFFHHMVYDRVRKKVVLFGGMSANLVAQNDLWSWDGSQWTIIPTTGAPPPRGYSAVITYDEVRSQLVLFGGGNPLTGEAFTDTWVLDQNNTWTQRTPANSPGQIAAYYHTMAFDPRIGRVILFGFGNLRSETWSWDGVNWRDLTMDPILSGLGHMVFESSRGQMLLVGGSIGTNVGSAALRQ